MPVGIRTCSIYCGMNKSHREISFIGRKDQNADWSLRLLHWLKHDFTGNQRTEHMDGMWMINVFSTLQMVHIDWCCIQTLPCSACYRNGGGESWTLQCTIKHWLTSTDNDTVQCALRAAKRNQISVFWTELLYTSHWRGNWPVSIHKP